jgi:hypothetical protein
MHEDRDFLDEQTAICEGSFLSCELICGQQRFLHNAGKRTDFEVNRVDMNPAAALRFFLSEFENAQSDGQFMHALAPSERKRPTPLALS